MDASLHPVAKHRDDRSQCQARKLPVPVEKRRERAEYLRRLRQCRMPAWLCLAHRQAPKQGELYVCGRTLPP